MPDLLIKRIPGGSHWVVHEYPELINRYIRDLLEEKPDGTSGSLSGQFR